MSDTSIVSASSYKKHNTNEIDYNDDDSSCCAQHWFKITSSVLILITIISSGLLVYFLNKQTGRDRERLRIKNEFKRKHGVADKVLDMIMKNGIIFKWIKAHKGSIAKTFKDLFSDIASTLFGE